MEVEMNCTCSTHGRGE